MKTKIIQTKQDVHWHIISEYLDSVSNFCVAYTDKTFRKLLSEMRDYVNKKLKPSYDGEIVDIFVTVLQKPDK